MHYTEISIHVDQIGCVREPGEHAVLQSYLLDASESLPGSESRAAVIVCPGGCYARKSVREGEPVALRFLAQGMQAFVLQYSTPARFPCALAELGAAVALIREHAEEWHINPMRIFVCGFSAGGHLCASLGTLHSGDFLRELLGDRLGLPERSWCPNGMILAYPVISSGAFGHRESCEMLLGTEPEEALLGMISLEKQVTKETVPAFIWHTGEDATVPVENSLLFAAALRRQDVPLELHIYERGGHGLALCDEVTGNTPSRIQPELAGWIELAVRWIKRR